MPQVNRATPSNDPRETYRISSSFSVAIRRRRATQRDIEFEPGLHRAVARFSHKAASCALQLQAGYNARPDYRLFYVTVRALTFRTLSLLADGEFHSGQDLAATLGVSRGAIWYALRGVDEFGIDIHKVRGRGYRLAQPLSLLDRTEVLRELGAHASRFALEILDSAESTNTLLTQRAVVGAASGCVIAAEWQSHGRGRRGRVWHSTLGGALTFSLLWRFQQGVGFLAGLSLAIGLAITRSLAALGVHDAGLKWPNDVIWGGRKLAGILIEMQGDMLGPSAAVIGIGLNCRVPDVLRSRIDQPVVDLEEAVGSAPDRNRILAVLLVELERTLFAFARDGFAPLREEWQRCHVYQRKAVDITLPDGSKVSGMAEGVAEDGTLLIATQTGQRRFHSGDVSVRCNAGERECTE
jgi:BirA family biotin operon repressor/biotin-[acetyl-CoA-carboxylase] ligase